MKELSTKKSLLETTMRQIPDYYNTMYLDGYKPYEIIQSAQKAIMKQHLDRQATQQADTQEEAMNVNLKVEVKKK